MSDGIMRKMYPEADIFSAGTKPEKDVNPFAVQVMSEMGIDISDNYCPR
jgi:protein-tyrosine-phosphatase